MLHALWLNEITIRQPHPPRMSFITNALLILARHSPLATDTALMASSLDFLQGTCEKIHLHSGRGADIVMQLCLVSVFPSRIRFLLSESTLGREWTRLLRYDASNVDRAES